MKKQKRFLVYKVCLKGKHNGIFVVDIHKKKSKWFRKLKHAERYAAYMNRWWNLNPFHSVIDRLRSKLVENNLKAIESGDTSCFFSNSNNIAMESNSISQAKKQGYYCDYFLL